MNQTLSRVEALRPALLPRLPKAVRSQGYDRKALAVGMSHIGVGAFHRCHQAAAEILSDDAIFDRRLFESVEFRSTLARHLDGLLSNDPIAYVRDLVGGAERMGRTM